ncbi:sulfatase-like hydrolase/transferase [Parenemella sanctibonifatiensis]|uniref:Phosphodiesterase n=1 Tax=Parenemella sanctibonifatiensis TaxID=2016505 RepID=A0A255E135_9ACTN|nr:sulfatase-like hydrolase/transferase [Parenemella sanctibonifatiensis]OYN85206.1 phosphodiesterase [Parenemella sanctibonifatiensis]
MHIDRPNIVVILTDDQGRWAMPHRMPELQMPHLKALLDTSLELDNLHCASPVCSPARASLLTGRTPSAHGVHDWLVGGRDPRDHADAYLAGQPTTAETLSRAGYWCALSGKWHVGDARTPAPGHDFWYAHRFGGGPYLNAPIWRDGQPATEPRYFTDAVVEEGLHALDVRPNDRPFLLQLNFTAPHDPWFTGHPRRWTDLYAGTDFPSVPRPAEPHPWARRGAFTQAWADPRTALTGYAASLSAVDAGLGRLRADLAQRGLAESTIIFFLSDNGFSCGHHGIWGKGNGTDPLNFWDNSVRVPGLVHVPGGPTGVSDALLSGTDLHPTICELAGVSPEPDQWAAGESFAGLLRGEVAGRETVVVASEYGGGRMITDGDWSWITRPDGPVELYHRGEDPDQSVNRASDASCAGIRADLDQALHDWFVRRSRPGMSGWQQPVTGEGQLQPVSRGLPADQTWASAPAPDGN